MSRKNLGKLYSPHLENLCNGDYNASANYQRLTEIAYNGRTALPQRKLDDWQSRTSVLP